MTYNGAGGSKNTNSRTGHMGSRDGSRDATVRALLHDSSEAKRLDRRSAERSQGRTRRPSGMAHSQSPKNNSNKRPSSAKPRTGKRTSPGRSADSDEPARRLGSARSFGPKSDAGDSDSNKWLSSARTGKNKTAKIDAGDSDLSKWPSSARTGKNKTGLTDSKRRSGPGASGEAQVKADRTHSARLKNAGGASSLKNAGSAAGLKNAAGAAGLKNAAGAAGPKKAGGAAGPKKAGGAAGLKNAAGAAGLKNAAGAAGLKNAGGAASVERLAGTASVRRNSLSRTPSRSPSNNRNHSGWNLLNVSKRSASGRHDVENVRASRNKRTPTPFDKRVRQLTGSPRNHHSHATQGNFSLAGIQQVANAIKNVHVPAVVAAHAALANRLQKVFGANAKVLMSAVEKSALLTFVARSLTAAPCSSRSAAHVDCHKFIVPASHNVDKAFRLINSKLNRYLTHRHQRRKGPLRVRSAWRQRVAYLQALLLRDQDFAPYLPKQNLGAEAALAAAFNLRISGSGQLHSSVDTYFEAVRKLAGAAKRAMPRDAMLSGGHAGHQIRHLVCQTHGEAGAIDALRAAASQLKPHGVDGSYMADALEHLVGRLRALPNSCSKNPNCQKEMRC